MTAKRDLRETTFAAEYAVADFFAAFGQTVVKSVKAHAEQDAITPKARILILQDVDKALDAIYPSQRGGGSVLEDLVVNATVTVNLTPIAAEVRRIERVLKGEPDLLAAMKAGR